MENLVRIHLYVPNSTYLEVLNKINSLPAADFKIISTNICSGGLISFECSGTQASATVLKLSTTGLCELNISRISDKLKDKYRK